MSTQTTGDSVRLYYIVYYSANFNILQERGAGLNSEYGMCNSELARGVHLTLDNDAFFITIDIRNPLSISNVFTLASESNPKVIFSDQLQIHSIELPKADFTQPSSIQTLLSQWVDFFRNGHEKTEAEMNNLLADEGLALAIKKYRALCQDPTLSELAMMQEKAERDRIAELDYALEEGLAKGVEKGLKNSIVRRYSKQFPGSDASKIQNILESITDEDSLNDILDKIIDSETEAEFLAKVQQTR